MSDLEGRSVKKYQGDAKRVHERSWKIQGHGEKFWHKSKQVLEEEGRKTE